MPWDRKRLLGYVESIQLILAVTDNLRYYFRTFYTTKLRNTRSQFAGKPQSHQIPFASTHKLKEKKEELDDP